MTKKSFSPFVSHQSHSGQLLVVNTHTLTHTPTELQSRHIFFQMSEYSFLDPMERAQLDSKWAQTSLSRKTNVRNFRSDADLDQTRSDPDQTGSEPVQTSSEHVVKAS